MRYSGSCKLCPRNKKCDEEILKERRGVKSEARRPNKNKTTSPIINIVKYLSGNIFSFNT